MDGAVDGDARAAAALAIVVAGLGAVGYARKRSTRSLVGGLAFGGLYGVSAYFLQEGDRERGLRFGGLSSGALALAMGYRAVRYRAPFPAAVLAAVGVAAGGYFGWRYSSVAEGEGGQLR
jgi:uncharacterized membrane protein (UPF0136 family)